jgi:hypothetical protein
MYSLSDHIKLCRPLNDAQIMHLMQLLGKGCRRQTKEKLERRLTFAHIQQNHGIYTRLMVFPNVQYVAGQDYPGEIATVRKCLLG